MDARNPFTMSTSTGMPSSSGEDSKPMAIQSLISPPIKSHDSFQQSSLLANAVSVVTSAVRNRPAVHPPPSPPVSHNNSPENKAEDSQDTSDGRPGSSGSLIDPVLYPGATTDDPQPLFPPTQDGEAHSVKDQDEEMIDSHISNRSEQMFRLTSPPSKKDYKLFFGFVSSMMGNYDKDRKGWLKMCRNELKEQNRARREYEHRRATQTTHRTIRPAPQEPYSMHKVLSTPSSSSRVSKTKRMSTSPRSPPNHSTPLASSRPVVSQAIYAATAVRSPVAGPNLIAPRPVIQDKSAAPVVFSAQAPKRMPKATVKKVESDSLEARRQATTRADKNYESIPNYSPPLSSLDGQKAGCMRVEWRGQHMDLSRDPLVHLLHREEVHLAGCIRVDCATYLTAKRRIFQRRLECLLQPKEFRKTDAQQACHIDVNKASKMWQAFDKVGWLDAKWMAPHAALAHKAEN